MSDALEVPKGWQVRTLGEICRTITDGTHYTPTYVERGVPFYSVENVTNDEFINVKHISLQEHRELVRRCRPKRGDILMTRIGSLGHTKYLDWEVDASIYVSLALLRANENVDARYLYAFTKSRTFLKSVEDRSLLWAAPKKINMGDIELVPVSMPTDTAEQSAIAEILFTADEQIRSLKRLIAKKKAIKQGMLQQLLNGRAALEWPTEEIRSFASIGTGSKDTKDRVSGGRYPFFVRSQHVEHINSWSFDGEAVLTAGDGVGTGKVFHYIDGRFDYHQRVYRISNFHSEVSGRYFFYQFSQNFMTRIESLTAKSSVDSVRMETIAGMRIPLPKRSEQDRIVSMIDDAEAEISVLRSRLEKAKSVKIGMMQQLLTGRIRLPVEATA